MKNMKEKTLDASETEKNQKNNPQIAEYFNN
jgi:hypothetical protein